MNTIAVEDQYSPPFFHRLPISITRGEGVYVWNESGRKYLDFTAGWGVTSLGHAHPVIVEALERQAKMILQTPNASLTYSPVRAQLLALMAEILPPGLTRMFFCTSGSEANDAAIKLARKVTGKMDIVVAQGGFHGRMESTARASGLIQNREQFDPLSVHYRIVKYGEIEDLNAALDESVAAVLLEPIQGEGGVIIPPAGYLAAVSELCRDHRILLIIDEVQTGFCRTGPIFATSQLGLAMSFMSMGKGIAGGFPFAALAMTEEVSRRLNPGDHGGTYLGNPLGCAVALAVIRYLIDHDISSHVATLGEVLCRELTRLHDRYPFLIREVRVRGLMAAMEVDRPALGEAIHRSALQWGVITNLARGNVIRLLPPLIVTKDELLRGVELLEQALIDAGIDRCDP